MKIFKSLEYFINHVIDCEASQIASLFQGGSSAGKLLSFCFVYYVVGE